MFLQHRLCPQKPGEERTRPEGFTLPRATDEDFPRAHMGACPRGLARRVLLWKRIREAGKRGCKWTVPEAGSVKRLSSRCFPRQRNSENSPQSAARPRGEAGPPGPAQTAGPPQPPGVTLAFSSPCQGPRGAGLHTLAGVCHDGQMVPANRKDTLRALGKAVWAAQRSGLLGSPPPVQVPIAPLASGRVPGNDQRGSSHFLL